MNPFHSLTKLNGGGERDRTDDLLRARQALSQLSYTPEPGARFQVTGARKNLNCTTTTRPDIYPRGKEPGTCFL